MNLLLAMQQENGLYHADNNDWDKENEKDGYVTPNESDEEVDVSKWGNRNDEAGDIMASQRHIEARIACPAPDLPKDNAWWNVAERESRIMATPLSELGSPRVIVQTPQQCLREVGNRL